MAERSAAKAALRFLLIGVFDMSFLPVSKEDMKARGIDQLDFCYVIGDAYVDHPSFGPAIISRVLEKNGFSVGIISQPDWTDEESVAILGRPRLGFLICGGNMDTMVAHYSVGKKKRQKDMYSPGGKTGLRPDRATIVYGNLIRKKYKGIPIIIGGIEASLRRLGHYDYWSDKVKRSILLDSAADILSYGMGEKSIVEIARALDRGTPIKEITNIRGTVFRATEPPAGENVVILPDFNEILENKRSFAASYLAQYRNTDPINGHVLVEKYKEKEYVVQNPGQLPLTTEEMDAVYELPFERKWHPMYDSLGGIPGFDEVRFSIVSCRGCFGSCNYCALTFHQGRIVQSRSHESIIREATLMTKDKDFKGYIHDVGGPTANFRKPACKKQTRFGACADRQCLAPTPCKNLEVSHDDYLELLHKLRRIPGVKKVFIRSGIRFDYLVYDKDPKFFKELCMYHVSGQLKVAPEHVSDNVLALMGKPEHAVYERFLNKFVTINKQIEKTQYVVPYLISSHPGSTLNDAIRLAEYLRDIGHDPEQVQDFYPTPGTVSTCMYYTGLDPFTMKEVFVPKTFHEKALQRALLQYRDPKNRKLVEEALKTAGREDLIGFDKKCLLRPRINKDTKESKDTNRKKKTRR